MIMNALASTFGGQKNSAQALKLAVYAYTPAWVAGVFSLLTSLTWLRLHRRDLRPLHLLPGRFPS